MRIPTILVLDDGDDLGRQVGRAIACLRPRPELVLCPGVGGIEAALAKQPAVDVVIAGPAVATAEGLLELRRLRLRLPESSLILAFDKRRPASLRDTIRTGAVDILRLPVDDSVIVDAILQALEARWGSLPEGGLEGPGRGQVGEVIAIVSATGGCGKTFLATNMAYHLHALRKKSTCVIDLDLQFGELSTSLRLKPKTTIIDLLAHDEEDLSTHLDKHLVVHSTGIPVLAAPERPAEADGVDGNDVKRVIDAARRRFDYVIVDTPPSISEAVMVALEHADRVYAMATLDLPSIRNLGLLLTTMTQLKVPDDRIKLILNKVEPDVGMEVAQVTRHFPQGFEIVVPYGRDANRSLNMGMPLLAFAPNSDVGKAVGAGLAAALPVGDDGATDDPAVARRRLGRLRRRTA